MARRIKNPLAQALGLVLQDMRDKMGGISSSEIASKLGLAASHYRMIEAGSAILQSSRAIRVVQTFETIEFVPLCEVLVAIQVLESTRKSVRDMKTTTTLLMEATPSLTKVLKKLHTLWKVIDAGDAAEAIVTSGLRNELAGFLTTAPIPFTAAEIDDFMSPTYEHPLSGRLYGKIGNILQGVAPFYLDAVLQLTDNLKNITPRVTAEELARWEDLHQNKFSHLIGVVRKPEIVAEVGIFDYNYLWEDSFQKILIIYRDGPAEHAKWVHNKIAENLRNKFEADRLKYERHLQTFDDVLNKKVVVRFGGDKQAKIDEILLYRDIPMNNLWSYIMLNGYVVPFIDNATVDSNKADIYGTSLGYDETSEKLFKIRKLCGDIGLEM